MATCFLPTVETIHDTFVSQITQLGGCVTDDYRHRGLLLLRSVVPHAEHVRPNDAVQGGVALRTTQQEIFVHPYTFRKVCQNGAVMALVTDTRRMVRVDSEESPEQVDEVLEDLCVAVQACGHKAMLRESARAMRSASNHVLDPYSATNLLTMLASARSLHSRFIPAIMARFARGRDQTLFGLMNAVTSLARDTRDAETRWRLEELGGAVPALVHPRLKPGDAFAVPAGQLSFATYDDCEWSTGMPVETVNSVTEQRPRRRRLGTTASAK